MKEAKLLVDRTTAEHRSEKRRERRATNKKPRTGKGGDATDLRTEVKRLITENAALQQQLAKTQADLIDYRAAAQPLWYELRNHRIFMTDLHQCIGERVYVAPFPLPEFAPIPGDGAKANGDGHNPADQVGV